MNHAELLSEIPIFEGLSEADREALAARMTERTYTAGQTVFAKGDAGSSMYLVLSGSAQIFLPPAEPGGEIVVELRRLRAVEAQFDHRNVGLRIEVREHVPGAVVVAPALVERHIDGREQLAHPLGQRHVARRRVIE